MMHDVDLHKLANLPGWGEAHSELCRAGHPTERPRSADIIEYQVQMEGPRGGIADVNVMAESVTDAIRQARHMASEFELLDVVWSVDDEEDIKITRVCAYD